MEELTDLEICKRIAEIDGVEHLCDRGVVVLSENYSDLINTICSGRYAPEQVVRIIDKAAYNPLTDDALCFKLMAKYQVEPVYDKNANNGNTIYGAEILNPNYVWVGFSSTANKAICLAIIEAYK